MIHHLDASLASLLTAEGVASGDTQVVFDAPTRDWAARRAGPCVNAFLYDIREDVSRREVTPEPVLGHDGRITGRRPPPRRLRLSYLLTAWTNRPEDEHRLLSALLGALLRHDVLPHAHARGSLGAQPIPVLLQLALPAGGDRGVADVWNALGGELKPSLDLVVIAPFDPARLEEVAGLVTQEPKLKVTRDAQPPARASAASTSTSTAAPAATPRRPSGRGTAGLRERVEETW